MGQSEPVFGSTNTKKQKILFKSRLRHHFEGDEEDECMTPPVATVCNPISPQICFDSPVCLDFMKIFYLPNVFVKIVKVNKINKNVFEFSHKPL